MMKNKKYPDVKIERTTEAKIFEAITAAIVVASWFVGLWLLISGKASGAVVFPYLAYTTFIPLFVGIVCYRPDFINLPVRIKTPAQVYEMVRMTRVMNIELAVMFFFLILGTYIETIMSWTTVIFTFVLIATLAFSCIHIKRIA